MISGITIDIEGRSETLRFTTRAMMAAEQKLDAGLVSIIQQLESDMRVGTVVMLLGECGNDGKGMDNDRAVAIVDELGLAGSIEVLGRVVEAAFPEASGGKPKGAVPPKK